MLEIAERLSRNEPLRRRSVETLLKWFGAARRGRFVVADIREALLAAGLETDPDFTQGGVEDFITFRLIGEAERIMSSTAESAGLNPAPAEPMPAATAGAETVYPNAYPDEPSDDFLEPEADDGPPVADDDRPTFTMAALRDF